MGGFLLNLIKPTVVQSISVVNSLRMGVFLFIDGPALVCGWVNFPILWPHPPVQTKFKCPQDPGERTIVRYQVCPVAWLKKSKLCPCLPFFPGFCGHFEILVFLSKMEDKPFTKAVKRNVFRHFFKGTTIDDSAKRGG